MSLRCPLDRTRARRRAAAGVLALVALLAALPARAWDATRMAAAAARLGAPALLALAPLQALLVQAATLDDIQRVPLVNAYVNGHVAFRSDAEVWGVEDYWASPLETLSRGLGDCEDFAIAKYAILRAVGVTPQRLRLVYVLARLQPGAPTRPHLVLAYYAKQNSDPLVLDNLEPEPLRASRRADLRPLFSFNAEELWQGLEPAGDPLLRLARWREAWIKTRGEGFP